MNSLQRVLGASLMIAVAVIALLFGTIGVHVLTVAISAGLIVEWIFANYKNKFQNKRLLVAGLLWLAIVCASAVAVGGRPWVMLLLLLVIASSDIGAWFFGRGKGAKMWVEVSAGKTWKGQIAGIICGTLAAVIYGFVTTAITGGGIYHGAFLPQLMWIGMSVALLSQYGDLLASWAKRQMGIKDYSNIIYGHGGLLDRFDGWIIVLPLVWLVMV